MRCELVRDYRFEAAHRLPHVAEGHPCSRVHGHSYRVAVHLSGEVDPSMGWLVDFSDVDRRVAPLIAQLDHRMLNEIEGLKNPTCELLAAWLWQRIVIALPEIDAVVVSETPDSKCIYRGE